MPIPEIHDKLCDYAWPFVADDNTMVDAPAMRDLAQKMYAATGDEDALEATPWDGPEPFQGEVLTMESPDNVRVITTTSVGFPQRSVALRFKAASSGVLATSVRVTHRPDEGGHHLNPIGFAYTRTSAVDGKLEFELVRDDRLYLAVIRVPDQRGEACAGVLYEAHPEGVLLPEDRTPHVSESGNTWEPKPTRPIDPRSLIVGNGDRGRPPKTEPSIRSRRLLEDSLEHRGHAFDASPAVVAAMLAQRIPFRGSGARGLQPNFRLA